MSRIFEALQRADLERKIALDPEAFQIVEPENIPFSETTEQVKSPAILVDEIARRRWSPSLTSLPTLADRGAGVEQFRGLRTRIYQLRNEAPIKTILVSSGMPGEGKTFVAANLAMSLARNTAANVLLIDGDLRRPTLHNLLGAPNKPGLSEYLAGTAELKDILQRDLNEETLDRGGESRIANLTFIPAGAGGDDSSEAVSNPRMEALIVALAPHFNCIVIDSPPVLAVTDAVDLARVADGVLLVARGASTPFDVAQRAQAAFSHSRILGFVVNAVKGVPRNASYSYYYGEEEDGGRSNRANKQRRQ
jgi:capsular exopolysaccharide synthesis family protein